MTARSTNARKQPIQQRSAATVEAIIEAAARILETHGHAGYNTNDIARVAGISIGSLYQYFPNKDAITRALMLREMKALTAAIEAASQEASGRTLLEHMIEIGVRHQLGRSVLARLLDVEEVRMPPDPSLEAERKKMMAFVRSSFDGWLPDSVERGRLAHDVFAIARGMVDAAGSRGETDVVDLSRRVRQAVFGYLAPVMRA